MSADAHVELPSGWTQTTLGDIATIQRGASPRPITDPRWFDPQSGIGWVRISDATAVSGRVLVDTADHLSSDGVANSRFLPSGSLVMSICATIGIPAITGLDACIHDGFVGFTSLNGVDQTFLLYKLRQLEPTFRSLGQTGSQANLNSGLVRSCEIVMPRDIAEQRAIAETLADFEDSVGALDALIAKKRDALTSLIDLLPTGILSQLRPVGGDTRSLGELCSRRSERWDSLPAGTIRVDLDQLGSGTGQLLHALPASAPDVALKRFLAGDVLFGRLRAYLRKTWHANQGGVCTTEIWPLVAKEEVDSTFLAYLLRSSAVVSAASATQGTHMPRSEWSSMSQLEVACPPEIEEQQRIGRALKDFDLDISALVERRRKLVAVNDAVADDLLSGRVRLT